jgi:hypothetical protein
MVTLNQERYSRVLKKVQSMNVGKKTIAEVHKINDGKYPYAIILNFNDHNVYNHSNGYTLISGMDLDSANELTMMVNDIIK